jgi:broad specificity phosphatase PhoE
VGRKDLPVDAEGLALWPRVKADLLTFGIQRVLTSELLRARVQALDLGLPSLVLAGLNEQSFGDWEDVPWTENRLAEAFFLDPVRKAPPGGESFAHCASRALLAIQGALHGEESTLVLAHGGSLRAILAHFLGLPLDRALDLAWQPYGLTLLEVYSPNKAVLRFHNRPLPFTAPGAG